MWSYALLFDTVKSFMGTRPAAMALKQHDHAKVEEVVLNEIKKFHVTDDFKFLLNSFLFFVVEK